ncbi:putative uncharacterized transposon-derived protein F52C9.6, partial [Varanus komodoensis]
MRKVGLDESPVGIKFAGRNINNLRYADDTTLMAESEEELKSLLMWVEEESAKVGLKLNIKKTKIMASGPLTSWKIDGEEMEVVTDFILLGSKITADGYCSQEIKRRLLLGRKAMANLDSILKSRDITLPTKVCIVKAMVFPVAMHGCESWTIRKAEHRRIEAFELCWRRLLRVPWTARQSNWSVLEGINPDCSLEGQILKLKLKYFGHLMRRKDSLEKNLMLGTIEGKRRGRQRMRWLDGVAEAVGLSLSGLRGMVEDRKVRLAILNWGLSSIMDWMRVNKLRHNSDKMEVIFDRLEGHCAVLDGVAHPLRDSVYSLGVLLDLGVSLEYQPAADAMRNYIYKRRSRKAWQTHPQASSPTWETVTWRKLSKEDAEFAGCDNNLHLFRPAISDTLCLTVSTKLSGNEAEENDTFLERDLKTNWSIMQG